MIFSEYQKAIFENVKSGTGNTLVEARAGCSKTTSLLEALKYVPKKKKILIVAFNKKIAEELKERAPDYSNLEISTLHSLGFKSIRKSFGSKVKFNESKTFYKARELLAPLKQNKKDKDDYATIIPLCKITSLCKGYLIDTPTKIDELMDQFGIDIGNLERPDFIKKVCELLRHSKSDKLTIDYDDMIYFPNVYGLIKPEFDRVFIDEAQDLNPAQINMALSACKPDGRILALGDEFQSIYQFRGADSKAIWNIKTRLNCKTFPLPLTYRCAKSIVREAQKYVPDIIFLPNAPEGKVEHITDYEFIKLVKPGDFVISRTNAPLIKYCLALLKLGVPSQVEGQDIELDLSTMIKKSRQKTVASFVKWLDSWKDEEIARLSSKKTDPTLAIDKYECLINLCEGCKKLEEVKNNLKKLFGEKNTKKTVIFGSTHKMKGRESETCFILDWTYLKKTDQSEINIKYVAISRSKLNLYYVNKTKKLS